MNDLAATAPAAGLSGKRAYKLPRNLGRRLGRSDRSQLAIWFWELDRVLLAMILMLIAIGLIASIVSNLAVHWKSQSTLDDTLDVFPCHGVGGMVGMLLTGVFAKDVGLINGEWRTFGVHLLGLAVVSAFAFIGSWVLYRLVDTVLPMRVCADAEIDGLDLSQHGEVAATFDSLPEDRALLEHVA